MPRCSPPISGPTCFFLRLRLFSWWAARAKATVPRAVANRTFRRPGVSRSCENADCRERGRQLSDLPGELLRGTGSTKEQGAYRALGILVDQGDSHLREGTWPAALKCGPQRCKERAGDGKMTMPRRSTWGPAGHDQQLQ